MAAEEAKMTALAAAAMAAEEAKMTALATALADAATLADDAQTEALRLAGIAADDDEAEALRLAGIAADDDEAEALRLAGIAADDDEAEALRLAGIAADDDQAEALRLAGIAADDDQAEALRLAGIAADDDQAEALRLAGIAAGEDQVEALRLAGIKAGEDQVEALRLAGIKAGEDQVEALRLAGVEADAKLMAANNGLVTALQELDLEPASDTVSVEDQIAANTATLKAAFVLTTDERDTAQAALFAAGVEKAILEANAAMQTYARLLVTYESIDADAATAAGLVAAANRAKTEADEALAEAQAGDDVVLMARAESAVKQADAAVLTANAQLAEARTTASAMPYAMAIMTQATTPAGLAASATRKADAVTVSVSSGSGPDSTLIAKGSASDAGHGWYKANVANEDDSNETATVYTNIENTMMKFNAVHLASTDAIDSVANTGVLTLENGDNADELRALNKYVSASKFPGASDGDLTLTYGTGAEKKFDGTFDGVTGEYSCTSMMNCTATADSKGELTGLVGDWTFIPAYLGEDGESNDGTGDPQIATREDDLPVPNVAVPDTDYLHFGWWTKVDKDGDVAFQTFSGGLDVITSGGVDLIGTATYKGPAAGRYAVKTFNSNSTLDSIRHGEFTAAAELTANFGGPAIAQDDQNSISGTVTDFASQSDDLSAWSVDLKQTGFTDLTAPLFNNGEVGGGVGGSPVTSGKWSAQFFGNPAVGDVDATLDYPLSVAGEFDAHSSHGHVAGAFGATK